MFVHCSCWKIFLYFQIRCHFFPYISFKVLVFSMRFFLTYEYSRNYSHLEVRCFAINEKTKRETLIPGRIRLQWNKKWKFFHLGSKSEAGSITSEKECRPPKNSKIFTLHETRVRDSSWFSLMSVFARQQGHAYHNRSNISRLYKMRTCFSELEN